MIRRSHTIKLKIYTECALTQVHGNNRDSFILFDLKIDINSDGISRYNRMVKFKNNIYFLYLFFFRARNGFFFVLVQNVEGTVCSIFRNQVKTFLWIFVSLGFELKKNFPIFFLSNNCNGQRTIRIYSEMYPNGRMPDFKIFKHLYDILGETGTFRLIGI